MLIFLLVAAESVSSSILFFRSGPRFRWIDEGCLVPPESDENRIDACSSGMKNFDNVWKIYFALELILSPIIMVQCKMAGYLKGNFYWRYTHFQSIFH